MTIPVTTRTAKGSPLTTAEMDTNLTNLAREAIQSTAGDDQGNVELADEDVTTALVDPVRPVVPEHLGAGVQAYLDSQAAASDSIIANQGSWTEPTSGLIFKWGKVTILNANPGTQVTFTTPFPSSIFVATCTYNESVLADQTTALELSDLQTTGFLTHSEADPDKLSSWIALGN